MNSEKREKANNSIGSLFLRLVYAVWSVSFFARRIAFPSCRAEALYSTKAETSSEETALEEAVSEKESKEGGTAKTTRSHKGFEDWKNDVK